MAFLKTDYTTYGDAGAWEIDYALKEITHNDAASGSLLPNSTGNYDNVGSSLNFFKWLATVFATNTQMDDEYPIESQTPTVFVFNNGWKFGSVNDFKYLNGGSVFDPVADSLWTNVYSIGSQTKGTQIYGLWDDTVEGTPWWISSDGTSDGNIDILVPVKIGGISISSPNTSGVATPGGAWFQAREFGESYDHNFVDLSAGGRNPVGINTAADGSNISGELFLSVTAVGAMAVGNFVEGTTSGTVGKIIKISGNDVYLNAVRAGINIGATDTFVISETITEYSDREGQTATGESTTNDGVTAFTNVVAGYTSMSITFGAISRDLNNGAGTQSYDVEVDINTQAPGDWYEYSKYVTRYGSAGATYTLNGDDGQEYRSTDEGNNPEVKVAPFGTLAGTTFYGATGVWVTNYASADFVLIDAGGVTQSPPNYQSVSAAHTSLSGVNILVCEISGGNIIKNQYTSTTPATTTITSTTTIDINKTPQGDTEPGSIIVGDVRYNYTSFSGAVFSGVTPDASGISGDFYVPLLSLLADATTETSSNIIYDAPFDVRTSVRKYGFKPYDVDTSFGPSGLSFAPILAADPQAT